MKKHYLVAMLFVFLLTNFMVSAQQNLWTEASKRSDMQESMERNIASDNYRVLNLDLYGLKNLVKQAPANRKLASKNQAVFSLPTPDGGFENFTIFQSSVMHPDLAAKYPNIQTYSGQGIDDPTAIVRFDITPKGFHGIIFSAKGTVYIDPQNGQTTQTYVCYNKKDFVADENKAFVEEGLIDEKKNKPTKKFGSNLVNRISDGNMRTYRTAVSCTGEYAQFHGGTVELALAAIVTTMNRVTGIYERDLAIRFELIANNDQIIYTNAATDPYTNASAGALINQSQSNIDAVIGFANYDVGHTFSTGAGGLASLGVICSSSKARGVTGTSTPTGDPFDVDFVSHEIGHQFGGNHTFNGSSGNCSGLNRNGSTAYEPGSGTTIQAYAGICSGQNIQNNSDDYFHGISLEEMINHITGSGGTCAVTTPIGGAIPTADAGADYTIPANTPFALTGSGTDADGDALTYCWEEFDLGPQGPPDLATSTSAPIFRSFQPTTSPTRTFPQISDIVNNIQTQGEILPSVSRSMTFRMTVRDNRAGGGSVNDDEMVVTVENTGAAFAVTAPNTAVTWSSGSNQTVTWTVAGTDAAPINTANVNILLSTDGGFTYPTVLASDVPNNGSATVVVPAIASTTARIRVEASGNIFFDISNANFTIENSGPCTVTVPTGLASSNITSNSATISWGVVASATSYDYRFRATGTTTWTEASVNVTSASLTSLAPETEYEFQVRAVCPDETSAYAASSTFTTLEVPPPCSVTTPTGLATSNISDTGADISWNAVGEATSYNYRYRATGTTTWTEASTTSTSASISGLTELTEYEVQVNAECPDETSAYSASVIFTTEEGSTLQPCTIAPQNLSANSTETTSTITWDEVENANFYQFRWRPQSGGSFTNGTTPTNTLELTGLTPNTTYVLNIRSACTTGTSPVATFNWTTSDGGGDPCDIPGGLSASAITETGATLSWNAEANADSYNVRYREDGTTTWTTVNTAATSTDVSGLSAGTTYEYQVETVCASGTSGYSASSTFTTESVVDPCDVPTGLSSSAITTSGATISWSAATGANSYNYRYRVSGTTTWTTDNTTSTSADLSGLAENTTYECQVESVCTSGNSGYSASSTFTTESSVDPCDVPIGLSASAITMTEATISWSAATGANSYNYRFRASGTTTWNTNSTTATSSDLTGLSAATTYEYQVESVCTSGNSGYSGSATFETQSDGGGTTPCTIAPQNFVANTTSTTADLSWSPVEGVILYQYRISSPTAIISSGTTSTNSLSLTGLAANTTYNVLIRTWCGSFSPVGQYSFSTGGAARAEVGRTLNFDSDEITYYPNPTSTRLNVFVPSLFGEGKLSIFDARGVKVYSQSITNRFQEIDVKSLDKGMYILRISNDDHTVMKRFVKE